MVGKVVNVVELVVVGGVSVEVAVSGGDVVDVVVVVGAPVVVEHGIPGVSQQTLIS